jgi:O-antigen ligase
MVQVSWGKGNIGNGHNAYLDLWLELGLVGCLAWLAALRGFAGGIAGLLGKGEALGAALAVCLLHLLLYGGTERVLLEHSDLGWLLPFTLALQAQLRLAADRPPAPA